jgi:hypothetical protein
MDEGCVCREGVERQVGLNTLCVECTRVVLGCSRRHCQKLINGTPDNPARLPHFQVGDKKMIRAEDLSQFICRELKMGQTSLSEWEAQDVIRL